MKRVLKRKNSTVTVSYLASGHVGSIHGSKGVDARIKKAAGKSSSSAKTTRNRRTLKFSFANKTAAKKAAKKIRLLRNWPVAGLRVNCR